MEFPAASSGLATSQETPQESLPSTSGTPIQAATPPSAVASTQRDEPATRPAPPPSPKALPSTCIRVLEALAGCQKKHPREPYVCQHLQRAAGWCLFKQACPAEVDALEACAGATSSRTRLAVPPVIPPKCHQQVLRFEACLAQHQVPPSG